MHGVDPTAHRVKTVEFEPLQLPQHGRAHLGVRYEAAVRQRHQDAPRADKACRFVQTGRRIGVAFADVDFLAGVGAATGGCAVGQDCIPLIAYGLDVEHEARPGLDWRGLTAFG